MLACIEEIRRNGETTNVDLLFETSHEGRVRGQTEAREGLRIKAISQGDRNKKKESKAGLE